MRGPTASKVASPLERVRRLSQGESSLSQSHETGPRPETTHLPPPMRTGSLKRKRSASPLVEKHVLKRSHDERPRLPTALDNPRTRNTLLPRPFQTFKVKQEAEPIVIRHELANGIIDLVDEGSDDEIGRWDDVGITYVVSKMSSKVVPAPHASRTTGRKVPAVDTRDGRSKQQVKGMAVLPPHEDASDDDVEEDDENEEDDEKREEEDEDDAEREEESDGEPEPRPIAKRPRRGWAYNKSGPPGRAAPTKTQKPQVQVPVRRGFPVTRRASVRLAGGGSITRPRRRA